MSKINIDRTIDEIRIRSTSLRPIIEAIYNSIDTISSERKVATLVGD